MIIARLTSGLGNQLFEYAVGRQLSLTSGLPLKLDCTHYFVDKVRSYKLGYFDICAEVISDVEVARFLKFQRNTSLIGTLYRSFQSFYPKHKRRQFVETGCYFYDPELMSIKSSAYLYGYWQHYKYYENLYPQILDELTVKDEFMHDSNGIISEILQDSSAVSIHVRRGDYARDPKTNRYYGLLPMDYYDRAVAIISQSVAKPKFYVFSDDLLWVKENFKINGVVRFVDIESGTKDYLELYAMSKCRHNIIANSTFSWWGAFLNRNAAKIVIAPSHWVNDPIVNETINLPLPTWVRI